MVIYYRDKFIKVFLASIILIVIGIFFIINVTWFIDNSENIPFLIPLTYLWVSVMLIAYGLHFYSIYLLLKAKGYSGWLTFLGLINVFGFAIVALLPDKRKSNNP